MMTIVGRWLALLAVTGLLLSCAMAVRPDKEVGDASREFARRLRWKDFNGAAAHLAEEHRDRFLAQFGDAGDLNLVDVRLESLAFPEEGRAETWSVLEYYLLPSPVVRTFRLRQEWTFDHGVGAWRIVTPFPPFPPPSDR